MRDQTPPKELQIHEDDLARVDGCAQIAEQSELPRQATSPSERLQRVQIVNRKHPHFEEYGRFTGKVITMMFTDKPMAEVKLENCRHGTDGCFVSVGDVRQVAER